MRPAGEYTSEEDRNDRPIPTVSDTPVGWVILAERGPMDTQVECRGWDAVLATFGGFTAWNLDSMGPLKQFFDEGGELAHVVRTCHHTDPADPATKTSAKATCTLSTSELAETAGSVLSTNAAPYNLEPGDTLVVAVLPSSPSTATFSATAATRSGAATAPYTLANAQTLTVSIDGGAVQTVQFLTAEFADIANATAAEVAAVLNAKLTGCRADVNGGVPRITSDTRGTSSGVNVTGGTANGELGFTTGNVAGTGNVADIEAVSAAEVKTIVEAAIAGVTVTNEGGYQRITSNTPGGSFEVIVMSSSTADDEIGFDNAAHPGTADGAVATLRIDAKDDGSYANAIRIIPAAPSSGEAGRFNLKVERAGVVVRTHENLSMDPADPRYVETIVNDENTGDALIRAVDLAANVADTSAIPALTAGTLTGGGDGLVSLDDNDFIGGATGAGRVGFRCLDKVAILGLLCPQRATPGVELAKLTYIETYQKGRCFTVCEAPAGYSKAQMITYWKATAGLYRLSRKVAGYWPRVKIANPNRAVYGNVDLVTVPIGGLMFGLYARGDAVVGGAFEHPAGTDTTVLPPSGYLPRTVLGLETDEVLEPVVAGELQAALINPIRRENGPFFVDGSLVANDQSAWSSVGQSRGIIWAMKQCAENVTFMRHRRINDELLEAGAQQLETFWEAITAAGKLASRKKSEAYFIDAGKGLNTRATKKAKQTFIRIGVATDEPNVHTNLIFSPYDGADVAELQAS